MQSNSVLQRDPRQQHAHLDPAVEALAYLRGVSKRFGQTEALRGVDLAIHRGEVVALLGPNGAGKTTAISILLGLRRPDRGEARLCGHDPRLPQARRQIGATPQETGVPFRLTVGEVLDLVRAHYSSPAPPAAVLERFGLLDLERRQIGGLSGGQRRRLAVALAFAGNPKVVFLDEPTTGLDVEARRGLWTAIRNYVQEGGTILLTTHLMEEAEALATRVVILDHGQVLAAGNVEAIKARARLTRVRFRAAGVPVLPGVVRAEQEHDMHILYTPDGDALVQELVRRGVDFVDLEVRPTPLEEAYLVLTRGAA
ncbi:MAG: ABC transporter ATP-binding protein [Chloroflexota bacterium]|nr:ABC transporter ATP-binding protein [Chloroflexota bacterium]